MWRTVIPLLSLLYFTVDGDLFHEFVTLSIPWPSGILVDNVQHGGVLRFGRVQHSAIKLRKHWALVNLVENVLNETECASIIMKAEMIAETHGWSVNRHVDYYVRPTNDLPVHVLFGEQELESFILKLQEKLWPILRNEYGISDNIFISDFFITQYDSRSIQKRLLGPHRDKTQWSFVISLNNNFEGGGTFFVDDEILWRPPIGSALVFNGQKLHGGEN